MRFADATPEQFREFWEGRGIKVYQGSVLFDFFDAEVELNAGGRIYIQDQRAYVDVKQCETLEQAAEAINALRRVLG